MLGSRYEAYTKPRGQTITKEMVQMVGKVTRIHNIVPLKPRKKRPKPEDFKRVFDPDKPPDNIA